jgi:glutamate synthase domain-containing protein 2/glutamate synthase domain-containing protein 1/glutamate synthase domain-containing protein 3
MPRPLGVVPAGASTVSVAPLYHPSFEHDACGVGLVVDVAGRSSRTIVERALRGLVNLTHRGGVGADSRSGDGAGILTQIPSALFQPDLARLGATDPSPTRLKSGELGVAMCFLPQDVRTARACRDLLVTAMREGGIPVYGWREVEVDPSCLGESALQTLPQIAQLLVQRPVGRDAQTFERDLMLARKAAERAALAAGIAGFDVVSCSARTIVYKGFCLPEDLPRFYADLRSPAFTSAIALFHQRYSTNTVPTWALAQPFRFIAHNGEINTVQGNRYWMMARDRAEEGGTPLAFADGVAGAALRPVVSLTGSDSLSFDNTLELLYHGGRSLPHALMMLVPEPWEQLMQIAPELRAFYDFHAGLMEQWDGPAALTFSDGVRAGATLDRNGLRPLRYAITADGLFIAGSEAGTVEVDQATVVEKGRLGPGQMILVDTERGVVLRNAELKGEVATARPYAEWLAEGRVALKVEPEPVEEAPAPPPHRPTASPPPDGKPRVPRMAASVRVQEDPETVAVQRTFGYTAEDIRLIVQPMAGEGKEPTWSMGDDAPLAVLSEKVRPLSAYFRQRFAQVTNPAIDSLRERKIMALDAYLGPRGNLLVEDPTQAHLIHLPSIVLTALELDAIKRLDGGADSGGLTTATLSTLWPVDEGEGAMSAALERLLDEAEGAVRGGAAVLVLSDRGVSRECAPLPMLLAVGAIHHHLIRLGLRLKADLVCETGEVWDVHHLCTLIGYGASAVHPYLAFAAASVLAGGRGYEGLTAGALRKNYKKALEDGFLKVSSKMGISTASGYRGAQIFETIGLSRELVDLHFAGTPARLGGIGLAEIEVDVRKRHGDAYGEPSAKLPDFGLARFRKDGETHAWAPTIVKAIQEASTTGSKEAYQAYRELVKQQPLTAVRDLLEIKPLGPPVPLAEVEPIEAITRRFVVTAMSLGALSPEAYRTLAIAMNRLGARSNSGEGGEDPHWYNEARTGPDRPHSKVKQVASGRFGVTANYLSHAEELEIKIAQGSKPGEGGQLPGHKVTSFIARLRYAVPGLPLISPPPHHDIYSIEDLAQLIYDLRQINPKARIGVKLVSEAGVGTVAAGVAKARADYILISGHNGGTGASPLASIKHAGSPWELGLAETQQTLVLNGLRSRVRLRTDGGLKTAEDVIVAALLGAEEFGFGTSVLVAVGCDMARQCHLNTCPTGVATQREDLRAKFTGTPEQVVNYFLHLAGAIREVMAALGARTIDELVGRSDLLTQKQLDGRAGMLDLAELFAEPAPEAQRRKTTSIDLGGPTLDDVLLPAIEAALDAGVPVAVEAQIATPDRTVGAKIANAIQVRRNAGELAATEVTVRLTGSAGQSLGAFVVHDMHLFLEGEANDYVGKGMSGGEIAIRPPAAAPFTTPQAIAGNTILYGATGGALFAAGRVGERFAVRNSGATAVVEGVGDHGCEYMTGGLVAILGPTGRNFGAGMTNGLAFVYDEEERFAVRTNEDSVELFRVESADDSLRLRELIERHVALTGSAKGRAILEAWSEALPRFWMVVPKAALEAARAAEAEAAEKVAD